MRRPSSRWSNVWPHLIVPAVVIVFIAGALAVGNMLAAEEANRKKERTYVYLVNGEVKQCVSTSVEGGWLACFNDPYGNDLLSRWPVQGIDHTSSEPGDALILPSPSPELGY